jgi:hypothetical protein
MNLCTERGTECSSNCRKTQMSETIKSASGFSLPTTLSEPISEISHATMLLYGEKKIGKTSLASRFPDTLFLMFEPGGGGLRIHQEPMSSWGKFVEFIDLLERSDKFQTIAIDTIDLAYERCFAHVCEDAVMDHPTDRAYGAGWKLIDTEFKKQMARLMLTGRGVIFISHVTEKEMETMSGRKYQKLGPTMSSQASRFVIGVADILAYYGYYGEDRYLTIRGSDAVESGHRLRYNFLTPEGAKALEALEAGEEIDSSQIVRVHSIPMGDDEAESYRNFMRAFNNLQTDPMDLNDQTTGLRERAVKMKSKR